MQMILPMGYGKRQSNVKRSCIIPECSSDVYGYGYCNKHYSRWKRYGDPYMLRKAPNGTHTNKTCRLDECNDPARLRGYCNTHGLRFTRHGDPHYLEKPRAYGPEELCAATNCNKPPRINGYCPTHNARVKSNGSPDVTQRQGSWAGITCYEPQCMEQASSKGWCRTHYIEHNMDLFVGYTRKRRAAKKAAFVIAYTKEQLDARMAYWGNKCWMCGGAYECVDHVKPLNAGGADCIANFRPACSSCNSSKRDRWHGITKLHTFIKS